MAYLTYYLMIDHIKIENANAISSPLTYGFPAISGFLGAVHALNRKLDSKQPIYLDGVLIACHDCDVQVYRPHRFSNYTFRLTRNPVAKNGSTRSIIEEGRVHLDVSLVVEVKIDDITTLDDEPQKDAFVKQVIQALYQQRIAGGNVVSIESVTLHPSSIDDRELCHLLLPGYVLCEAKQDLQAITAALQQHDSDATELDALIEMARLHHHPQSDGKLKTTTIKQGRGWLVPLQLGYRAISPLFAPGQMQHVRSDSHPTQFVESVYGLGKWVFPLRLKNQISTAFWRYQCSAMQSNDAEIYVINQECTD